MFSASSESLSQGDHLVSRDHQSLRISNHSILTCLCPATSEKERRLAYNNCELVKSHSVLVDIVIQCYSRFLKIPQEFRLCSNELVLFQNIQSTI